MDSNGRKGSEVGFRNSKPRLSHHRGALLIGADPASGGNRIGSCAAVSLRACGCIVVSRDTSPHTYTCVTTATVAHDRRVAALAGAAGEDVDPTKPYAELWMGTHPSGPSIVSEGDGMTLKEWIAQHPAVLGDAQPVFGTDLPFLFKVLSVETALSIQSHPDKALAQKLHAQRPRVDHCYMLLQHQL